MAGFKKRRRAKSKRAGHRHCTCAPKKKRTTKARRSPSRRKTSSYLKSYSTARRRKKRGLKSARRKGTRARESRDWPGQPYRHKRASALGWQRKLRGKMPKHPTFHGRRPVKSSAKSKRGARGFRRAY